MDTADLRIDRLDHTGSRTDCLPLTWSLSPSQMLLKSGLAEILGRRMWTEARTVVPRLDGQNVSQPRRSSLCRESVRDPFPDLRHLPGEGNLRLDRLDALDEALENLQAVPIATVIQSINSYCNLLRTCPTLPPFCMEMMRRWSSSLTQTRNVLSLLW